MKIVPFAAEHTGALIAGLDKAGLDAPLLRIEPYVRHYYLSNPACRLMLMLDGDGQIAATLGSEKIRLRIGSETFDAAVLSSTFSLLPGAFPLLFMHWMKSAEVGLAFPGNALLQDMFARQKRWVAIPGLRRYWLNWSYPVLPDDPAWKSLAKPLARWARRVDASGFERRLRGIAPAGLALREERRFDSGMTPRAATAFGFRVEPDADFLDWRFDSDLDYVRYRIFRIERGARSCGCIVIAEWPHCLLVSHADCDDVHTLSCAILLAIARLNQGEHRHRKVLLSSMHSGMQQWLSRYGFEPEPRDTAFHVAAFGNRALPQCAQDDWLVNLDIGDAGPVLGMVYKP